MNSYSVNRVSKIGDEVEEELEGEDNGALVKGLNCNHGGNLYLVLASEDVEFVQVEFQYRVLNDFVAAELDDQYDVGETFSFSPNEQPELMENAESKMDELFGDISEDVAERFYIEVLQELRNESVAYEIKEAESNQITGFDVYTKLFPLDNEISVKEFHDAVQSILSIGLPTRAYIQYSYGLRRYKTGPLVLEESLDRR